MTTEPCQNFRLSSPSIFTAMTDCILSFFLRVWDFESPCKDLCLTLWAGVCLVSSVWCWGSSWTCQPPSASIILFYDQRQWTPGFLSPVSLWSASSWIMPSFDLQLWCPDADWFLAHNHGCMYTTRLDFLRSWPNLWLFGFCNDRTHLQGEHSFTLDINHYFESIPVDGSKVF